MEEKLILTSFRKWQEYCKRNPDDYVKNSAWLDFINKPDIQKVKNDFTRKYIAK